MVRANTDLSQLDSKALLDSGDAACLHLEDGSTETEVVDAMHVLMGETQTDRVTAAMIVSSAVRFLCPGFSS